MELINVIKYYFKNTTLIFELYANNTRKAKYSS